MISISLTNFVDFVSKSGGPKLTVVQDVVEQHRHDYDPVRDFWKPLREAIPAMHRAAGRTSVLDAVAARQTDSKKQSAYPRAIAGYKKFLGRKRATWLEPPTDKWTEAALEVSINPEVALEINGAAFAIKLYFRGEPLSKTRADIVTELMGFVLSAQRPEMNFAVLDVQRGKLLTSSRAAGKLMVLARGEAASFAAIYKAIASRSSVNAA